jgi:hypothetical protein
VYEYIREHGGFDGWEMEVIEECSNLTEKELHQRERVFYDELGATLNGQRPWVSEEEKKEVDREKTRRWREANLEAYREANRKWSRRWVAANPDKVKACNDKRKAHLVFCWCCRDRLIQRHCFKTHCGTKTHLKNLLKWALARWRGALKISH